VLCHPPVRIVKSGKGTVRQFERNSEIFGTFPDPGHRVGEGVKSASGQEVDESLPIYRRPQTGRSGSFQGGLAT
jgi:hypothetical protein